ncbi:MAG: M48 family metalloprotease, partial [Cyanobacteria bacterium J06588_5]
MTSTQDLECLFQEGTAAYKKSDYAHAIVVFSGLSKANSRTYRVKASMGLVRTYIAQQNWLAAEALCQKIGTSSNLKLQQWSQKTLKSIEQQADKASRVATPVLEAKSGFEPISPSPSTMTSGFQPLPTESAAKEGAAKENVTATQHRRRPSSRRLEADDHSVARSGKHFSSDVSGPPDGVSMFHYAYLNGEDDEGGSDSDAEGFVGSGVSESASFEWPYCGRLNKGRSLGKIKRTQLWFMQIGGAIAFYFLWRSLIRAVAYWTNEGLYFWDDLLPFRVSQLPSAVNDATWLVLGSLGVLLIISPWVWDLWLRFACKRQTFSINSLRSHSPESATLINRYCRQRRWALPKLWKLSTDIPLIFSYGWLPRNARLVISQGLLDQLKEDEMATLIAYEMSHWKSWHWPMLSLQGLVLQGLLTLYWQLARWGNQRGTALKWAAGVLASGFYGLFWLSRIPGLGLARVRTYYGDRTAAELTGNPNSFARALSKLSFGLAASVDRHGYTPALLEGLTPQLPVAADLSRYQLYAQLPLPELFVWDSLNPLRRWMSCMDTHPPLGDRLRLIMAYAQHWKLSPEIMLAPLPKGRKGLPMQTWKALFREATPYVGCAVGLGIGLLLWGVGAIAAIAKVPAIASMYKDIDLLKVCLLLGLGTGILLRINRYFPDLALSMPPSAHIASWFTTTELLPASSLSTKLSGTLGGRPGIANWLGQDLLLKTPSGMVKLHFFSAMGPLGNRISLSFPPALTPCMLTSSQNNASGKSSFGGQTVQVLGWFRRGSHPWIDVDKIRLSDGRLVSAQHPIFS